MIVLIEPLTKKIDQYIPAPPLPLLELASYVKEKTDVDLRIVDLPVDYGIPLTIGGKELVYKSFMKDLEDWDPIAIGISCTGIVQAHLLDDLVKRIRAILPDIFIFVGGYFPTLYYKELLEKTPEIDLVVAGEGEIPIVNIVKALTNGETPYQEETCNLVWKENDRLVETKRDFSFDLNKKAFLDLNLLTNPKNYAILGYAESRGCAFKCAYCPEEHMRPARKSIDLDIMRRELETMKAQGNFNTVFLNDALFGQNQQKLRKVCEIFRDLGLGFTFETRCDVLQPEMVSVLAESGSLGFALGFESASYASLVRMNKVKSENHYRRYMENTRRIFLEAVTLDVPIVFFIMNGYPGETLDDLEATYNWALELKQLAESINAPGGYVFKTAEFRVMPGTKVHKQVLNQEFDGVEYENDGVYGRNAVLQSSPGITREVIHEYAQKIFKLSSLTPKSQHCISRVTPFLRLPFEAYLDDMISEEFFIKESKREIFDVKNINANYDNFRNVTLALVHKYWEQVMFDSEKRHLKV